MDQNSCALNLQLESVVPPPPIPDIDLSNDFLEVPSDVQTRPQSLSVLVLDDDVLICRALSRLLKRSFDRVYTACTGSEARRILRSHTVHFLLCDFDLGPNECDGTVLTAQLRAQFPTIRHAAIFSGETPGHVPSCEAADAIWQKGSAVMHLSDLIAAAASTLRNSAH